MDIGFNRASFNILAAVELDPACCATLKANLPSTLVLNEDVSSLKGDYLLERVSLRRGQLDVLFGGPPCQSFSLAGNRKGLNDARGRLLGHFVRLVRELAPKAFVMENVRGMANWSNGRALDFVLQELSEEIELDGEVGRYVCKEAVLNAVSFGVAQYRERLFIVGNRLGKQFRFPEPTHSQTPKDLISSRQPHVTVWDAIGSLPPAGQPSEMAERISRTIKGRIERHGY